MCTVLCGWTWGSEGGGDLFPCSKCFCCFGVDSRASDRWGNGMGRCTLNNEASPMYAFLGCFSLQALSLSFPPSLYIFLTLFSLSLSLSFFLSLSLSFPP